MLTGLTAVASAGLLAMAARARAQDQPIDAATCSTEEECACLEALNANTVGALETYLQQYPLGSGEDSACATLAFEAVNLTRLPDSFGYSFSRRAS